jgi:hypothetical protein
VLLVAGACVAACCACMVEALQHACMHPILVTAMQGAVSAAVSTQRQTSATQRYALGPALPAIGTEHGNVPEPTCA